MNESRAARYQRRRRRAQHVAVLSVGAVLAGIALTPVARELSDAAAAFGTGLHGAARTGAALVVFVAMVTGLAGLAALPAVLYRARQVASAYPRGPRPVDPVFVRWLRMTAVALVGGWGVAGVIVAAVALAGGWWWGAAGVALAAILALLLRAGPALVARSARVRPLSRRGLAARLEALAADVQVPVAGIDEWPDDGGATTALVGGIGRSRRVMVSTSMVRDWSDDEIAVVVAHELAHHAHHDLVRTWGLNAALILGGLAVSDLVLRTTQGALGLAGPGDPAALPLIILVLAVVWAVTTPVRHAQSRRQERRADACALRWTGAAEAFGAAVRRLGQQHLAEDRPSTLTRWLHHRHPSVAERLRTAEAYARPDRDEAAPAS